MASKRTGTTAAELVQKLSSDSAFVRRQQIREEARQEKATRLLKAGGPLVSALEAVGINMISIWDLVNSTVDYSKAVFIMRDHLLMDYPDEVLEGIARALAIPAAEVVRSDLIRMLKSCSHSDSQVAYSLALAVSATTHEKNLVETLELAKDRALGTSRLGLLLALKRFRKSAAVKQELTQLLTDPDLSHEIRSWK